MLENLIIVFEIIIIYMTLGFILAALTKRNDIADALWGLGFVVAAVAALFLGGPIHWIQIAVTLMVGIWGIRLASHIIPRIFSKKEEDFRYAEWRKDWLKKGKTFFYFRSWLQVFVLQGVLMFMVVLPVLITNLTTSVYFHPIVLVGMALWLFGFIFEAVADRQLRIFLKKRTGSIMDKGLWKYSRHPNYFGEVVQWWGIWFIALAASYGWVGIIGPITITVLILYVSGIPLLEKKYRNDAVYAEYRSRTSAFVPLKPFK